MTLDKIRLQTYYLGMSTQTSYILKPVIVTIVDQGTTLTVFADYRQGRGAEFSCSIPTGSLGIGDETKARCLRKAH